MRGWNDEAVRTNASVYAPGQGDESAYPGQTLAQTTLGRVSSMQKF